MKFISAAFFILFVVISPVLADASTDAFDVPIKEISPASLKGAIGWLSRRVSLKKSPTTEATTFAVYEKQGASFVEKGKREWCHTKWMSSAGYHGESAEGCDPAIYPILKREPGYVQIAIDVTKPELVWISEKDPSIEEIKTIHDKPFALTCLDPYTLQSTDKRELFESADKSSPKKVLDKTVFPYLSAIDSKNGFVQVAPYRFVAAEAVPEGYNNFGPPVPLGWISIWDASDMLTLWQLCPYDSAC